MMSHTTTIPCLSSAFTHTFIHSRFKAPVYSCQKFIRYTCSEINGDNHQHRIRITRRYFHHEAVNWRSHSEKNDSDHHHQSLHTAPTPPSHNSKKRYQQHVDQLTHFLTESQTPYPKDLNAMLRGLGINRKDARVMLYTARQRMRGNVGFTQISREQRNLVKKHMLQSPHPANTTLICNELEQFTDLPRGAIYRLVRSFSQSLETQKLSTENKDLVKRHVEESPHPHDVAALCVELEEKALVPRNVLSSLIRNYSNSLAARSLSDTDRKAIKEHVENSVHRDAAAMCDELQQKIGASRGVLSTIVRSHLARLTPKISEEQREIVRSHFEESDHQDNIPLLCDELQTQVSVPRRVLKTLLYSLARHKNTKNVTREQREMIRARVEQSVAEEDVSSLCDELNPKMGIPRDVLYQIVRNERNRLLKLFEQAGVKQ
mmetsp:Transcript_752/g.2499  ORF Transcript_752/g.2499 Transcript_752/m.2499 type:complete len:432 (-) Transcript_752:17-1312(-)